MATWFREYKAEDIQNQFDSGMLAHLGIECVEIGPDYLIGSMPVDHRTQQPFGLLHGGASCVLAESLGSIASNMTLDPTKNYAVGLDINANHLRSARSGLVFGKAEPVHLGRKTHVWQIKITDEKGKMICISRLTMAVLEH